MPAARLDAQDQALASRRVLGTLLALNLLVVTTKLRMGLVAVAQFERARGRALASDLLIEDASHMDADAVVTGGLLVGLRAARSGWWWAEEDRLKEDLQLHEVLVHVEPC